MVHLRLPQVAKKMENISKINKKSGAKNTKRKKMSEFRPAVTAGRNLEKSQNSEKAPLLLSALSSHAPNGHDLSRENFNFFKFWPTCGGRKSAFCRLATSPIVAFSPTCGRRKSKNKSKM